MTPDTGHPCRGHGHLPGSRGSELPGTARQLQPPGEGGPAPGPLQRPRHQGDPALAGRVPGRAAHVPRRLQDRAVNEPSRSFTMPGEGPY